MTVRDEDKTFVWLNYIFPIITLYTLFASDKKEDPAMRFHGWTALLLGVLASVTCGITWLYGIFYCYKTVHVGGEMTIPMLTDFARQQAEK